MVVLAVTWMAKAGHDVDVHRHKTEPRRFFIYEQYKDDASLEAHRAAPHFLQYARKDLPKVADRVEGHLYEALG
jgi:quinol monooxygenase YgiN